MEGVSGYVVYRLRSICFLVGLALFHPASYAGCDWSGAAAGVVSSVSARPIVLERATSRMLVNRSWREDSRFPVGSLLARETLTLGARLCGGLYELSGSFLDVHYVAPQNAKPHGSGFLIPGSAPGVSMLVEFPKGVMHSSGVFLGTSTERVRPGGHLLLNRTGISPISLRLSLVKTGTFSKTSAASVVSFADGLGLFRYFAAGRNDVIAIDENQLVLSSLITAALPDGKPVSANARAPSCRAEDIGSAGGRVGNTLATVRMAPVANGVFSGPGPIEFARHHAPLLFSCDGSLTSAVSVSFDSTFPLNNGSDGVGMPAANSDVGIQILLNDSPVSFGKASVNLPWDAVSYDAQGRAFKDPDSGTIYTAHGHYCRADCGDDMSNANWVDGGAASGNNRGLDGASLSFRYYQTTADRPAPQQFSVPFTVSLDVH